MRTPLCELLGIEVPILQAPVGQWTSPELAAAVSEAGGLGSLMFGQAPVERVREDVARLRELTHRPFAINQVLRMFRPELLELTLELRPPVAWFALGDPGDLVERAHDAGMVVVQQVHTVEQAQRVVEQGVDVVVAQGAEAGGFGGTIATLVLVPQVVDAVAPVPVVAAGGIADGRGLAAMLALGAQGVNVGTRFLASAEARTPPEWQRQIVEASSGDAVKVEFFNDLMPVGAGAFDTLPRSLRTPFVDRWNSRRDELQEQIEEVRAELREALGAGAPHELLPFTGQSAGLVDDVLPAAEIVRRMVREAREALDAAGALARPA